MVRQARHLTGFSACPQVILPIAVIVGMTIFQDALLQLPSKNLTRRDFVKLSDLVHILVVDSLCADSCVHLFLNILTHLESIGPLPFHSFVDDRLQGFQRDQWHRRPSGTTLVGCHGLLSGLAASSLRKPSLVL